VAVFVGSGKLLPELEREVESSDANDPARFTSFVNQMDIARVYAGADAVALPSERDNHLLTATEAAAVDLPIIPCDHAGCAGETDVVQDARNASVYPCGDIGALPAAIEGLMDDPEKSEAYGLASREIADTQDIGVAATAIESAVLELAGDPQPAAL